MRWIMAVPTMLVFSGCSLVVFTPEPAPDITALSPTPVRPLVVEVLDVGQGDGIWIENGRSRVLIDAGQGMGRMAELIEEKELSGDTIDFIILTHAHADHHGGLREFFNASHDIVIRRFYENQDPAPGVMIRTLRDSIQARESRGELEYLDTDDPCGDGRAICTHLLDGGALLHILRPLPQGGINDRSVALKLIGPDSASFTMWLSGDAEHEAMAYFYASYQDNPGLNVHVLKGNHHGSCNAVSQRWLELTSPEWTTFGASSTNGFRHVHDQTKALHRTVGVPWYRTDENGRIRFESEGTPGSGYTVSVERGSASMDGARDGEAAAATCG